MIRNLKQVFLLLVLISAASLFLAQPFQLLTSTESKFPRWLFFLLPLADPGLLVTQIWGGSGIHFFDLDRLKIAAIGVLELAALWETGFLLLKIPKPVSPHLSKAERSFFAFLLGTATVSVLLSWLGFFGILGRAAIIPLFLLGFGGLVRFFRFLFRYHYANLNLKFIGTETVFGVLILLFIIFYLLAGTIPPFEYDMLEYHAQGAREIAESGRIGFFGHNIYLNMPLGTEMIYTAGILMNPFRGEGCADRILFGITASKFALSFVPLMAALGCAAFLKRAVRFDSRRALLPLSAALALLAFPEFFQVSANGLNDTVSALYLLGTFYALFLAVKSDKENGRAGIFLYILFAGFAAGFAAGCKYTLVPFLLVPASAAVLLLRFRSHIKGVFWVFCGSALLSGGGWYLKNLFLTGNPFYPLAYRIFGDRTGLWSAAQNLRWHKAHSADSFGLSAFFSDLTRLFADDFASMIFAAFALLILLALVQSLRTKRERLFSVLALFAVSFFLLWWFATHRLLRFLVPILPVTAILLAFAWEQFRNSVKSKLFRGIFDSLFAAGGIYALCLNLTAVSGFLTPIAVLAEDTDRYGEASVLINQNSIFAGFDDESHKKLLLVGEARAFAYRSVPLLYNTCWDHSRLAVFLPNSEERSKHRWNWTDEEIIEIKQRFNEAHIGAVLVDENEIRRFLSPGNYGLTDAELADPAFFKSLEKAGILIEEKISEQVKFYRVVSKKNDTK